MGKVPGFNLQNEIQQVKQGRRMGSPNLYPEIQRMFNFSLSRFSEVWFGGGEEDTSYGNLPKLF